MLSIVTGQLWEGAGRGSGKVFMWGIHFSVLFLPISPLNTHFLARATCQAKDTENMFVLSGLFVTAL